MPFAFDDNANVDDDSSGYWHDDDVNFINDHDNAVANQKKFFLTNTFYI